MANIKGLETKQNMKCENINRYFTMNLSRGDAATNDSDLEMKTKASAWYMTMNRISKNDPYVSLFTFVV